MIRWAWGSFPNHARSQVLESMRPLKTLDRVLSKAGIGSRTETRSWIGAGRVRVNGKVIQTPDHWVDLERDEVTLDGKPVRSARKTYLLLYKPKGYLTTYKDPGGRPTVYDLLEGIEQYVVPVGRLDLDTSGLLLLTNDTQFAERIMNPDYKVAKTYQLKAAGELSEEQLDRLRQGVELEDGPTRPAIVRRLRSGGGKTFLELTITEGRNRQVRRMLEAIGSRVRKLVRTSIGPLEIGKLEIGRYRELTALEVDALAGKGWFQRATSTPAIRSAPPAVPRTPGRGGAGTPGVRAPRTPRNDGGTGQAGEARRRSPSRGPSAGRRPASRG
jgi:pseudouridine synthase